MYIERFKEKVDLLKKQRLYRQLEKSTGLEFQHNDYLGLSTHPELLEAISDAICVVGAGSRGSRLLGGNRGVFEETEEKISTFFGSPSALLFSSGYLANLAVLQVLGECVDHVYSDEKNHASLIDGIRLSQARKTVIPHQEWEKLAAAGHPGAGPLGSDTPLDGVRGRTWIPGHPGAESRTWIPEIQPGPKLLVAEGVYSMDGDLLSQDFTSAALRMGAFALIDEAHMAGVLFESGRGTDYSQSLGWGNFAKTVTFGKAFGVSGAAILCSNELKELLVNRARTFIYTTAPSPIVAIGIKKALEIVDREAWRREEIWARAESARATLAMRRPEDSSEAVPRWTATAERGYMAMRRPSNIWGCRVPIIIIPLPGEDRALSLARNMREFGFDVRAIRYPTVPRGLERIRITLNLHVSKENTEMLFQLLNQVLDEQKERGVL